MGKKKEDGQCCKKEYRALNEITGLGGLNKRSLWFWEGGVSCEKKKNQVITNLYPATKASAVSLGRHNAKESQSRVFNRHVALSELLALSTSLSTSKPY